MIDLIQNNYMTGYSTDDKFYIDFNCSVKSSVGSYYDESRRVAEILWSKRLGKVYLFYSGGKDSEYLLNVFLSLKMPVTPVIISTQYNQHDVKYAFDFCKSNRLDPLIIQEDYDSLVRSDEFSEIFRELNYGSYYYALTCKWMPKMDGTVISGDSNVWVKKGADSNWYVYEPEAVHSFGYYFEKKQIYGSPYMLCYTPEQYLAFLLDPWIVTLTSNCVPGKLGSESTKDQVYNNQKEFTLVSRPKYHGCEIVENNDIFNHPNMLEIRKKKDDRWWTCYIEYQKFIRVLRGEKHIAYHNDIY